MKAVPVGVLVLLVLRINAGFAQTNLFITFTNKSGPHVNVQVIRVTETTVLWRDTNSVSGGSVRIADLPEALRQKLGFDSANAAKIEQQQKEAQEASRQQRAEMEAEAAKLQHWEQLDIIDLKPALWSRYQCLVFNEQYKRATVLIANLPKQITDLPFQIQAGEEKLKTLSQQIDATKIAILQRQADKDAAWDRYIYTSDDYFNLNTGTGGASIDNAATRRAAPRIIQSQIDQAESNVIAMETEYKSTQEKQDELKKKLRNAKVRAFFTGHYYGGLELWDCSPH